MPPALDKNSTHHRDFFAILQQFRVILNFVFAGQAGRVRRNVICINSTPTQMIDRTEKPLEVCKHAARYNEFGSNLKR